VIARIWQGHWLRKAGPFEVSDEVAALKESRDLLAEKARDAEAVVERLKEDLANSDGLISTLSAQLTGPSQRQTGKGLLNRARRATS
jgi:hypothetical protein